ncbi:helix-turn-helix domain-containing protein [Thalassospira lucentensis]|uniref:helix-turn-helix domain-containing protein n=1 Tax=Thalassospira lucentensis TaxID=168935 RepID=UPI003AA84ED5
MNERFQRDDPALSPGERAGSALADPPTVPVTAQAMIDRFKNNLSPLQWVMTDPARRDRCYAVLLVSGQADIKLRQGTIQASAPSLIWLPLGETQAVSVSAGADGYVLSVADDLVARHCGMAIAGDIGAATGGLPLRLAADTVHIVAPTEDSDHLNLLIGCFDAIRSELTGNEIGASVVVGAQLQVILTVILRLSDGVMVPGDHHRGQGPGSITFQRFLQVLELHFREHWNVADYAAVLGISERRLGSSVLRATGKSPLMMIHDRILREACVRLEQSPLGVAQIAYGLGFRDPAYFSRFFKRYIGEAPGAYRRRSRAEKRVPDNSFAAWP